MKFIQANSKNYKVGRTSSIKYLVIHFTANDGDTAEGNCNYFKNSEPISSAHYFVDEKEICQSVKESDTAYHCGAKTYTHDNCRNGNSIGIELCSRYNGNLKTDKDKNTVDFAKYYFKQETIDNAVNLTWELMQKYNISTENVLRHYDVTGKTCPAPFVITPLLWDNFINKLKIREIINTLSKVDIIAEPEKWYKKLEDDVNSYWLAKKTADYINRGGK